MNGEAKNMTADEVKDYLDAHGVDEYNLLDVRQDWEYEEFHLPGAMLIPLPELPDRLGEIAVDKPTLVYCAVGGRSSAAANLINGQGFKDVYNMLGGIMAWKNEYAVGPQSLGMIQLSGKESPMEILCLAYAMESNLGAFYSEMGFMKKQELADAFTQLVKFENGHKAKVFNLARERDSSIKNRDDMEQRSSIPALEGGMTAEEFLEGNKDYLKTPKGALEAAMMFEAQALDLYMRFALKAEGGASIELLHTLAQEEKNHLKILGKLMDRKIVEES
ncbi:MAG: sulfurtransferase [Deltaproteobacteria bacterium]|nr:sulfurtransferase [Deltaproteobacteria bacterium]MBW2217428.1 sulfurtransferase [Deltaproteobacteria bacterium]